jgi:DNA mismatch repair protein MutS
MSVDDPMNTPAMKQYLEIKNKFPDSILFFRMGDFYEMFQEDAIIASSILDIALTKRQNQIPMCGIPFHASESYASRLLTSGKRVVICEQIKSNDPNTKLLQREVVRVLSPGTIVEENLIKSYENNFLCLILSNKNIISLGLIDISTSEFYYSEFEKSNKINIQSFLNKFSPSEVIFFKEHAITVDNLALEINCTITLLDSFLIPIPKDNQPDDLKVIFDKFLNLSLKGNSIQLSNPSILSKKEYMELDSNTIRNLELIENQNTQEKGHTLFSVLNKCKTSGGKRLLKKNILFPYLNLDNIQDTWLKIDFFHKNQDILKVVQEYLMECPDIERIINRFRVSGKALPRDFKTILQVCDISFLIKNLLKNTPYHFNFSVKEISKTIDFIKERLNESELPAILGGEGMFIKPGFSKKIDEAREAKSKGKDWIVELENSEKKRTGLSTLKIRFNKVVGYFVEVSRKDSEFAPKDYFKKQTLVTSERYTFLGLQDIERIILSSDDTITEIEKEEFDGMVSMVLENFTSLHELSHSLSALDYHANLVNCILDYNWNKPEINFQGNLHLENSRHPVVEAYLKSGSTFVSNSIQLNTNQSSVAILTGPNMAGKSTFMRQVAICQILFQMGSYIPADKGNLSLCDKVFTRIGSGDNLTAGESTFFVEMKESAYILKNRTEDSLILFDEIGRGTSTYDGLSLAWAIVENLSSQTFQGKKTKTIFATHYHELTELSKEDGVFPLYMDTVEKDGDVVFLKKVKPGKAKKSFGIYVAKLAGVPESIVNRSIEILSFLESQKKEIKTKKQSEPSLFTYSPTPIHLEKLKSKLESIEPDSLTPKDALNLIYELKGLLKSQ